jgi:hypothetical protein
MTVHVFVGPTLSSREVLRRLPRAVVSGPAKFGDVYRAARQAPTTIALIDGYFERVPATWHKEILWAMSEGIHVFGASSMGALRAAELCDFGMVGVGDIFEAFRDGELEDDDEVAVAHGDESSGFVPVSDAMVNVRATLRHATAAGVLGAGTAAELTRLAKETFYAERSYPALLDAGASAGLDGSELGRFRIWLAAGRFDQKRADAERLLEELASFEASSPKRKRVDYAFEPTDAWHEAERVASEGLGASVPSASDAPEAMLEELKLEGRFRGVHAEASAFGWSLDAARRAGVRPDALAVRTAVETFRRDAGLGERQAFERWRSEEHVDDATLTRFFEERARASWAEPVSDALGLQHVANRLRAAGQYGRLRERAELKARRLEAVGLASPSLSEAGVTEPELWHWYFVTLLGRPAPSDLDAFARLTGFPGTEELRRAVLRDYCFRVRLSREPYA